MFNCYLSIVKRGRVSLTRPLFKFLVQMYI